MAATKKRTFDPRIETRLTRNDILRLEEAAKTAGKSRPEFMRQILLWYLDNEETLKADQRESEVAQAIRHATEQHVKAIRTGADRVCKMLARQGIALGTLYELTWLTMADEDSKTVFESAVKTAKTKMHNRLEKDESEIAEKIKKTVAGE